jgi:hypothetical protein
MSDKKQITTGDQNHGGCGCGCIGATQKKSKTAKPEDEKSKK